MAKNVALRNAAYMTVHNAIKAGKLTPQPCEECGFPVADAHHHDYAKPFDVKWLCRLCHVALRAKKDTTPKQSRAHDSVALANLAEQRLSSLSVNGHKLSIAELARMWGISSLAARSYVLRQGWGEQVDMLVRPPKTSRQLQAQQWIEEYTAKYGVRPTLQRTADHFSVSRERVRQWINALRSKGAVVASRGSHSLGRSRVVCPLDRKLRQELEQMLPPDLPLSGFVESLLNKYGLAYAARFARVSSVGVPIEEKAVEA